ncbi:MAG TPA: carboxylesterase [Thiotrichaceae bacterium]|jgi:phospholipase/carboxylesterase|nr:carboxylesterase [Thiotrichaceae bacterium]HIM08912.1 carboxylesterase [Gammaproteobacteria bacterium]
MSFKQDAVIIEANGEHKASVIWLHGLGADGHDFESIVPEMKLSNDLGIKFIFPNAPIRPVTINNGMAMRAWYDVKSANLREIEDVVAITESHELITQYIDAEIAAGISANKITLAGFSQGGAIALHTGLRYPQALAGLLALSTYLPLPNQLKTEASKHKYIPIMMAHGIADPIISVDQGRSSCQMLQEHGYTVEWLEYAMQHSVCLEEIEAIAVWIKKLLA